jgi:hypothetical protein
MAYSILMNKNEDADDDGDAPLNFQVKNVSNSYRLYTQLFNTFHWASTDTILLYETDEIRYYVLAEYKQLNFITYNKEAHPYIAVGA